MANSVNGPVFSLVEWMKRQEAYFNQLRQLTDKKTQEAAACVKPK